MQLGVEHTVRDDQFDDQVQHLVIVASPENDRVEPDNLKTRLQRGVDLAGLRDLTKSAAARKKKCSSLSSAWAMVCISSRNFWPAGGGVTPKQRSTALLDAR